MTAKNRYKTYVDNSYYHVYNRGVEKRTIFLDEQDYKVFLSYLKFYLSPHLGGPSPKVAPSQLLTNHSETIKLIAYCLMPNHFHLMLFQTDYTAMTNFVRALSTRYAMYFNKRYCRVGSLFQSRYKAVYINSETQYLYLTKYIHRNPLDIQGINLNNLSSYPYSSYPNYLEIIHQDWVKPIDILANFSKSNPRNSYKNYVEENTYLSDEITALGNATLDIEP